MRELITSALKHALNILVTSRPGRTCAGAAVGSIVACAAQTISADGSDVAALAAALGVQPWHVVLLGVLLAHIPTALARLNSPARADKDIASALGVIEAANFSEAERGQHYRRLIVAVYASVAQTSGADRAPPRAPVAGAGGVFPLQ
jgi:hypothetical protein